MGLSVKWVVLLLIFLPFAKAGGLFCKGFYFSDEKNLQRLELREYSRQYLRSNKEPSKEKISAKHHRLQRAIWVSHFLRVNMKSVETLDLPWLFQDISFAIEIAETRVEQNTWGETNRQGIRNYYSSLKEKLRTLNEEHRLTLDEVSNLFSRAESLVDIPFMTEKKMHQVLSALRINETHASGRVQKSNGFLLPWFTTEGLSTTELNLLWANGVGPIWHPMEKVWIDGRFMGSRDAASHDWGHITTNVRYGEGSLSDRLRILSIFERIQLLEGNEKNSTELAFSYKVHENSSPDLRLETETSLPFTFPGYLRVFFPNGLKKSGIQEDYELARWLDQNDLKSSIPIDILKRGVGETIEYLNLGRTRLNRIISETP